MDIKGALNMRGSVAKQEKFTSLKNSDGSVNILLLGADQRPWQSSGVAHTDTIIDFTCQWQEPSNTNRELYA